jgi:hypothetical protein
LGWEIIRDSFEDDHCRSFMLRMAFQTVVPPEWPLSGRLKDFGTSLDAAVAKSRAPKLAATVSD